MTHQEKLFMIGLTDQDQESVNEHARLNQEWHERALMRDAIAGGWRVLTTEAAEKLAARRSIFEVAYCQDGELVYSCGMAKEIGAGSLVVDFWTEGIERAIDAYEPNRPRAKVWFYRTAADSVEARKKTHND